MQSSHNERETEMKKFITFGITENETSGVDVNINVLEDPSELMYAAAGGYIESSDLDDLHTPATLMVTRLVGFPDEGLVEKVVSAFKTILTPEPVDRVLINGEVFA